MGSIAAVALVGWMLWSGLGGDASAPLPAQQWADRSIDASSARDHASSDARALSAPSERSVVPSWRLGVSVRNRLGGAPLVRAQVSFRSEGQAEISLACDTQGAVVFEALPGERGVIEARSPGFESLQVEVDSSNAGRELRLALSPLAGWLRGVVLNRSGEPLEGLKVIAWPGGPEVRLSWLIAALERGDAPRDTSGADGTFALEVGLEQPRWHLTAAGAGYIVEGSREAELAPGGWTELIAHPLYGTVVQWRDAAGGPLRVSPALREGSGRDGRLEGASATQLTADWPALALLGVDDGQLRLVGRDDSLFLFAERDSSGGDALALRLTKTAPGYQPADALIDLPRITTEIPRIDFRLQPSATEFSRVFVDWSRDAARALSELSQLEAPSVGAVRRTRQTDVVTVRMANGNTRQSYGFALWSLEPALQELGPVPCGEYDVWLEAGCGQLRPSTMKVSVAGERTLIQLPLATLSSAELSIVDSHGAPYEGVLVAHLESLRAGQTETGTGFDCAVSFVAAPYLIEGLPAKRYRVNVQHPPELRGLSTGWFDVGPSAFTTIVLRR